MHCINHDLLIAMGEEPLKGLFNGPMFDLIVGFHDGLGARGALKV